MKVSNPLFIIGNPRSGTSLFRLMLTSHPSISVPPECGFIQWWYDKYKNWSLKQSHSQVDVSNYIADLRSSKKIETWDLDFLKLEKSIYLSEIDSYEKLCLSVLQQFAFQQNKNPIYYGDKNNYYIDHLEILNSIFPSARYILIVRDGRDVACSYINMKKIESNSPYKPKLSSDVKIIAQEWVDNHKKVLSFFQTLNRKNTCTVRFEDLVRNPEDELRKICDFLNISYNHIMLDYSNLNRANKLEPDELMSWKKKTYQAPDISNINKYKNELSSQEILSFQAIADKLLNHFKYE